jgi:ABC-2 type transport system ATP-binding protein
MKQIVVEHLSKQYKIIKKQKGFRGTLKSLFKPERVMVDAVSDISFEIGKGEIVGYIGPNGAGKSTTIKMMIGILNPTSGTVHINGVSPHEHRKQVVRDLGVVFGQRTQLYWDLRLGESFELLKRMYNVEHKAYEQTLGELTEVLKLQEFINTPVRQLSLGQKMRGELAAAMIHSPSILLLDEPTIGLDLDAKRAIREFIHSINKQRGVTVLLTTHDLSDVSELCKRLIVINNGKIVEDGALHSIVRRMSPYRVITLELRKPVTKIRSEKVTLEKVEGSKIWCHFDHSRYSASEIIADLAQEVEIADLSVLDADIEDTVRLIYHKKE